MSSLEAATKETTEVASETEEIEATGASEEEGVTMTEDPVEVTGQEDASTVERKVTLLRSAPNVIFY